MNHIAKYLKYIYYLVFILFCIFSIIELKNYFTTYSNVYGLLYMIVTLILVYFFYELVNNFKLKRHTKRIKYNLLIIIIGIIIILFSSNIMGDISYIDNSKEFINKNIIIMNVLKPILYGVLFILSIIEFQFIRLLLSKQKSL